MQKNGFSLCPSTIYSYFCPEYHTHKRARSCANIIMVHIKRHYIVPEAFVTAFVTRQFLTGSLENPGGQIDDFNFETREWTPDDTEEDF